SAGGVAGQPADSGALVRGRGRCGMSERPGMSDYLAWRRALDHLRARLVAAQALRGRRNEIVDGEVQWATYEREVMCHEVNKLRARRGLAPVSIDDVRAKEDLACGHVDYTVKYAIGCADLVV